MYSRGVTFPMARTNRAEKHKEHTMKHIILSLATLAVLAMAVVLGLAHSSGAQQNQGPGPGGPPQESIDACNNLNLNDPCAFTSPRGEETGTCFRPEDNPDAPLGCRPDNAPPPPGGNQQGNTQPPGGNQQGGNQQGGGPGGGGPPAESYSACANLAENDPCAFQSPQGDMVGTCVQSRDSSQGLHCRPDNPPRQ